MAKLQLLIGMIASGKSSFCREAATSGSIILNDDAIVTAVHGGNYSLYDKALKPFYKILEMTVITNALALGRDVVIDRPCYKEATRRRYIEIAHALDCKVIGIKFRKETPEIHAKRRADSDGRGHSFDYWLMVAERHAALWEEPTLEEGYEVLSEVEFNPQGGVNVLWVQRAGSQPTHRGSYQL